MQETIQAGADELAERLGDEPAVLELRAARAALDRDEPGRSLIARYRRTHIDVATRQGSGEVLTDG